MGINISKYQINQASTANPISHCIKMAKLMFNILQLAAVSQAAPSLNRAALHDADVYSVSELETHELGAESIAEALYKQPKMARDGSFKHSIERAELDTNVLGEDYENVGESRAETLKFGKADNVNIFSKSNAIEAEQLAGLAVMDSADYEQEEFSFPQADSKAKMAMLEIPEMMSVDIASEQLAHVAVMDSDDYDSKEQLSLAEQDEVSKAKQTEIEFGESTNIHEPMMDANILEYEYEERVSRA